MKILKISILSLIFLALGCQRGISYIDLNQKDISLSCSSGHYSFVAVSNCQLKVSSNVEWCVASSSFEVIEDTYKYIINLEYSSNDGYEERVCCVSLFSPDASATVNVIQEPIYGINVDQSEFIVSCEEQDVKLNVKGNASFVVSFEDSPWISCNETTHTAPTLLSLHIQGNNGVDDRAGTIRLSNAEKDITVAIKVQQKQQNTVIISQTEYSIGCDGGVFSLEVGHNVDYLFSIDVDWISEIRTKSFSTQELSFFVQPNPTYLERIGRVSFTSYDETITQIVTVFQEQQDILSLEESSITCGFSGGQFEVTLLSNIPVSIKDIPDWVKVGLSANNSIVNIEIEKNESVISNREASICFFNEESGLSSTLTILQDRHPSITVSEDHLCLGYHSRNVQMKIWHNIPFEVNIDVPWIVLTKKNDEGFNCALLFNLNENSSATNREGTITLYNNEYDIHIPISIIQYRITEDLSKEETSNCYIVSSPGGYSFKATRGNTSSSVSGSLARVAWESFGSAEKPEIGDVIKNVLYSEGEIMFETSEGNNNGNALICLEDSAGIIQWSWHIWLCNNFDPLASGQVYSSNRIMMDRNLGALSSQKGDPLSNGLLYQWGRKDPFMGAASINSSIESASTADWPSPTWSNQEHGSIDYTIHNPMTFIYSSPGSGGDWHYSGKEDIDMTRWGEKKTEYDPCPPGWKIPEGGGYYGVWNTFPSGTDGRRYWDDQNKGFEIPLPNGEMTWYPTSGHRSHDSGNLNSVGKYASYWSYTCFAHYYVKDLGLDSVNGVFNDGKSNPVMGSSVRCIRE